MLSIPIDIEWQLEDTIFEQKHSSLASYLKINLRWDWGTSEGPETSVLEPHFHLFSKINSPKHENMKYYPTPVDELVEDRGFSGVLVQSIGKFSGQLDDSNWLYHFVQ